MSVFASSLETSLTDAVPASNYASDCFVTSEAGYNDVLVRRVPSGETRLGTAILAADDRAALADGIAAVRAGTEVVCSRDA
jgi:hypothetical protein